jgi:flagellar protein FliO/FliZ
MQAENPPLPFRAPRRHPALMPRVAAALVLLATRCMLPAQAGEAAAYAAPQPFTAPGAGTGTVRVVLALLLVLAAVYGAGWLMKRLRHFSGGGATGLQVLGQVGLGARERAVLLRAGDQQLLLGVANGSVRLLCELRPGNQPLAGSADAGATVATVAQAAAQAGPPGAPARPNFRELLMRSLGK